MNNNIILILCMLLFSYTSLFAYQRYPDCSYGPDGSYGDTEDFDMAPNGSFVDRYW